MGTADRRRSREIGKATGLPNDVLNQGIGWPAREGTVTCARRDGREILKLR